MIFRGFLPEMLFRNLFACVFLLISSWLLIGYLLV